MDFQKYVAKYLDEEGLVQRDHNDVLRLVRTQISLQAAYQVDEMINSWWDGNIDDSGFYSHMCEFAGDITIYDLLKSRLRTVIQSVLEKTLDNHEADDLKTLDVGCGTGLETCLFAETLSRNGSVVGIDNLRAMIEAGRKRAERRGIRNSFFVLADREKLPFPDNYFDRVFCQSSLESSNEFDGCGIQTHLFYGIIIGKRITEMYRVLRKGGKAVLAIAHPYPDDGKVEFSGRMASKGFDICQEDSIHGQLGEIDAPYIFVAGEKN